MSKENIETMNFGEHLTIDGYSGNYDKLNDKELVLDCLINLPDLLGMKKLAKPEVYFAKEIVTRIQVGGPVL